MVEAHWRVCVAAVDALAEIAEKGNSAAIKVFRGLMFEDSASAKRRLAATLAEIDLSLPLNKKYEIAARLADMISHSQ